MICAYACIDLVVVYTWVTEAVTEAVREAAGSVFRWLQACLIQLNRTFVYLFCANQRLTVQTTRQPTTARSVITGGVIQ